MDFTPDILLNDDIRKALVEGACPYVLSGGFRAEIESSEKVWSMLMQKVEENKQKENEKVPNDLTTFKDIKCDICEGEGYTREEYKPKYIQDGFEVFKDD